MSFSCVIYVYNLPKSSGEEPDTSKWQVASTECNVEYPSRWGPIFIVQYLPAGNVSYHQLSQLVLRILMTALWTRHTYHINNCCLMLWSFDKKYCDSRLPRLINRSINNLPIFLLKQNRISDAELEYTNLFQKFF